MRTIARRPVITKVNLPTAGTEVPFPIQVDPTLESVKRIQVKSRTKADLKYSYVSSGDFVTIFSGQTYWQDEVDAWQITLYLIGTVNNQDAEVEVWF